jgi:hypothetical protein
LKNFWAMKIITTRLAGWITVEFPSDTR